mmetsp:Transcript_6443/g.9039  ORF Transcript_6443/g.9039 Transcript_6443/m.9039 type:complete len:200 (-) Transcript_6443:38-637(-)
MDRPYSWHAITVGSAGLSRYESSVWSAMAWPMKFCVVSSSPNFAYSSRMDIWSRSYFCELASNAGFIKVIFIGRGEDTTFCWISVPAMPRTLSPLTCEMMLPTATRRLFSAGPFSPFCIGRKVVTTTTVWIGPPSAGGTPFLTGTSSILIPRLPSPNSTSTESSKRGRPYLRSSAPTRSSRFVLNCSTRLSTSLIFAGL